MVKSYQIDGSFSDEFIERGCQYALKNGAYRLGSIVAKNDDCVLTQKMAEKADQNEYDSVYSYTIDEKLYAKENGVSLLVHGKRYIYDYDDYSWKLDGSDETIYCVVFIQKHNAKILEARYRDFLPQDITNALDHLEEEKDHVDKGFCRFMKINMQQDEELVK